MSEPTRSPAEAESALAPGTRLGEFELRGLLGVGGFGIVYRAFDHQLEREVAIKEYMPASLAGRTETMHVSLRSRSDAEVFSLGLRSFVNEAKLLARFDHPSLLKVYRFWEANGTAYMAMPVLRGQTLKELRQSAQPVPIDEAWLRRLLEPLLGALEVLHAEGVYHRDIAPDNIEIEPDGHPVLLDFGAARRVIGDKTQTLTAILKPAYAPVEQYAEAGSVRQGPWTDLYALGATVHYLLLGRAPAPATARVVADDQAPLSSHRIDGCSEEFLRIVDWMLAPRPGDRPQNVAALRAALRGEALPPQPHAGEAAALAPWERTVVLSPAAVPDAAEPPAAGFDEVVTQVMARTGAPAAAPPGDDAGAAGRSVPRLPDAVAPSRRSKAPALALGAGVVLAAAAAWALWSRQAADGTSAPPASAAAALSAASASAAAGRSIASVVPGVQGGPGAPDTAAAPGAPAASAAAVARSPTQRETTLAASTPTRGPPHAAPTAAVAPQGKPLTLAAATPSRSASRPGVGDAAARNPALKVAPARPEPARPDAALPSAEAAAPPQQSAAAAAVEPAASARVAALPAASAAPRVEPARPPGPVAICSSRSGLSHFLCMERECLRSEFASHADCLKWHEGARQRN